LDGIVVQNILKVTGHKLVALIAVVMMIIGLQMPDSPVLLSGGMITLLLSGLLNVNIKQNFNAFIGDKALIALTLIFFIFLFSGINSSNMDYLGERLRIKLPFLAMPFAFVAFRGRPVKWFYFLLYLFFLIMVGFCIYEFIQYLSDYKTVNKLYETSYVIDTPGSHVRFSLMVAFAIFVGVYLIQKGFLKSFKYVYFLNISFTIFLIIYLHVLAVRSGILAFYLSVGYLVVYSVFKSKNYKVGGALLLSLIIVPVIAINMFPTLKAKLGYTQYSYIVYKQQNQINHFSDGARWQSVIIGYKLFKEHWLTGTGIGNLQDDMYKMYETNYPDILPEYRFIPHNEFLVFATGCGIFGLIAFIAILIVSVLYKKSWQNWLFAVLNIIIISSFFTEPTIEEQIGTAFYIIFFLILYFLIHYSNDTAVGSDNNI
jgi:O-antigen ligase